MKKSKSFMLKPAAVQRAWHVVDVKGKVLGRIATEIAKKLIGKEKATFTPNVDAGDFVVVINAGEVEVTRNKQQGKVYAWHSGFPGGFKSRTFKQMQAENPERVVRLAVNNMLPKNHLRSERLARLKIYAGTDHPHQSQVGV